MRHLYILKGLLFVFLFLMYCGYAEGQLIIPTTGTAFIQNFDGMGSSASASLPAGFRIGSDWSTGASATSIAYGTSGTGSVSGTSPGGIINWGNGVSASAADRALGFLNTGLFTSPQSIVVKITNNTGGTIGSLNISFDYEKYRSGSRAFTWNFFHGYSSAPVISLPAGDQAYPADAGNTIINNPPSGISKSISITGLSIANGADYYLKWTLTGSGGSTNGQGVGIDNFSIMAFAAVPPCTKPASVPTGLSFGAITDVSVQGSFVASSPGADHYLVVMSTNDSLTGNPQDGITYNPGDNIGDGTVISDGTGTNFTATRLNASTSYYFFVFSSNATCSGGPMYSIGSISGQTSTSAGLLPCASPASQPAGFLFGPIKSNSIHASFTATAADEYLVVISTSASLSTNPVNGNIYNAGDAIGNGNVIQRGVATSFTALSLAPGTIYYFYIFSLNSQNCSAGPAYHISNPLKGSQATSMLSVCATPFSQPSSLTFRSSDTNISGAFDSGAGADGYLVIRSASSTLSLYPDDNTDYSTGDIIGGGTVVANTSANSFISAGLTPGTTYYFFIFAENKNCTGGTKYLTAAPLTGSIVTGTGVTYNYYFGNWHSHSDYSDGNQDHPGYTPTDDYNYAISAQCLDFLGISEHNHFSSPNNPGNTVNLYHLGPGEANTFTSSHPGFVAMYGMEWGVISGGGHVLIYGDGMNELWGWESGNGGWGASSNYDSYVAKSDYTGPSGLFKIVNENIATNTFALLAHPATTDFNNIANTSYNAEADQAIVGSAVESGPATSTNTSYSNPAASMYYLRYYQTLLSKGYHLGPTIDHDNHNTTFGHTTYARTAVIAPALTKSELIRAMRNMHFYATEDCDTRVNFTINAQLMGTVFTDRYAPVISVSLTDPTTDVSSASIKVMFGIPGSGSMPVQIASATGSSMTFTDNNLANLATGYYYIDISNGTARIITSPIWYTRNDNYSTILPLKLLRFDAARENNTVKLSWKSFGETNTEEYQIERSLNGKDFQVIGKVKSLGNTVSVNDYKFYDTQPANGDNFYRLRFPDVDGKTGFSGTLKINFGQAYTFSLSPNPVQSSLTLTVTNLTEPLNFKIIDINGLVIRSGKLISQRTAVDVSHLASGIYFVRVDGAGAVYTDKLIIQ